MAGAPAARSSPSEDTESPAALLASSLAPRLAAMASSVYAPSSTLANTLNASRMGRYPVHRLRGVGFGVSNVFH